MRCYDSLHSSLCTFFFLLENYFFEFLEIPNIYDLNRYFKKNIVKRMKGNTFLKNHHSLRREKLIGTDDSFYFFPTKDMQHTFLKYDIFPEIQCIIEFNLEWLVEYFISILVPMWMLVVVFLVVMELFQCAEGLKALVIKI